jgi:hypothetical protein
MERFKADGRAFWGAMKLASWQSGYRSFWSVLAEEFLICQRGIVKLVVIVFRAIKELTISWVHLVVVLWELDIEVGNPAKLAINVPLLGKLCIVWHTCAFHFIFIVWVELSLRVNENLLLVFEILVEVLLKEKTEGGYLAW